jgi:hypothetical protein
LTATEIIVAGLSPSDRAATTAFHRLRALGTDVARVGHCDAEIQVIAGAVRGALQRRPGLLFLIGADVPMLSAGTASGADRAAAGDLPAGAVALDAGRGFTMLVASTYVVAVDGHSETLEAVWTDELGPCLSEWVGLPVHTRGELVVLDGGPVAVEQLLAIVSSQHPDVYLRVEPANGAGIRVCALAPAGVVNAGSIVDLALAAVERAAAGARLRVASTGHKPGARIDPSVTS